MSERQCHIERVEDDGAIVRFDDGSIWEVSIGDSTKRLLWYPTMRVSVEAADDSLFPFRLTNLDTAGPDVVKARLGTGLT